MKAAVTSEHEFVEIAAQAVEGAERPAFEVGEHAVDPPQHHVGGLGADDLRIVVVVGQPLVQAIADLETTGVFSARGGSACLLRRDELPTDWDPAADKRLTVWECAQHLARVLESATGSIVERFHKTVLNEFYRVAFRKKIYGSIDELQRDLDAWMQEYNQVRSHQGRWCYGKTPMTTFLDTGHVAREKLLPAA